MWSEPARTVLVLIFTAVVIFGTGYAHRALIGVQHHGDNQ
jgi:hypothetical protein